jgi:hypothetical protein
VALVLRKLTVYWEDRLNKQAPHKHNTLVMRPVKANPESTEGRTRRHNLDG